MLRRLSLLLLAVAFAVSAQKYDGPRPSKPDLPYLKHADTLVPTEAAVAKEEKKKDETFYTIDGAASTAKTPLAAPIFIFLSDKIAPERLELYRLDSKNGHREIVFSRKRGGAQAIRMEVTRLDAGLYKIEVDESLDKGEYSLTPEGSNQVFCFQVF